MEGARRLALVFGLAALLAGCGSQRAAFTRHPYKGPLYSVAQVRKAFDTLGLELKPTSRESGRVVLLLHKIRLGNTLYPVGSGVADVEAIVLTRRTGDESRGTTPYRHAHLTRYANVTLVAGRNYNDEARAALSLLRWGGLSQKPGKHVIVPASSIGGISLGEPRRAVEKAFGRGRTLRRDYVAYLGGRLRVLYAIHDTPLNYVGAVVTRSPSFRTRSGIHVGSTRADLRRLYAACSRDQCGLQAGSMPDAPGTNFFLRHGKVTEIWIFPG